MALHGGNEDVEMLTIDCIICMKRIKQWNKWRRRDCINNLTNRNEHVVLFKSVRMNEKSFWGKFILYSSLFSGYLDTPALSVKHY